MSRLDIGEMEQDRFWRENNRK